MNTVTLMGRFTANPELKPGGQGKSYLRFTIAVPKYKKGEASFIDCTAFDRTADQICQYFSKGDRIAITGYLDTRMYDKNGVKHKVVQVILNSFDFVETKTKNSDSGRVNDDQRSNDPNDFVDSDAYENDDDLPF